jgi:hypothetical protein
MSQLREKQGFCSGDRTPIAVPAVTASQGPPARQPWRWGKPSRVVGAVSPKVHLPFGISALKASSPVTVMQFRRATPRREAVPRKARFILREGSGPTHLSAGMRCIGPTEPGSTAQPALRLQDSSHLKTATWLTARHGSPTPIKDSP